MSLLSLEEWRRIMGISPWFFWGLQSPVGVTNPSSGCDTPITQYSWQAVDAFGRADIEQAIETAENRLFELLNYWPAPKYTEKTFPFPQYPDRRVMNVGYAGGDGRWQTVNVGEGYIQNVGVQTRTLIQANVALTYSDLDNDGLDETFSLSVATSVTDISQIALYFSSADRWNGNPIGEEWRVKPVNVTLSGGTATITGNAWLTVKPVLYEGVLATEGLNIQDATNFVTTLDVYRLYIDPTGTTVDTAQEKLIWETEPWPSYCVCDPVVNSSDPAALGYAPGRGSIRDAKIGQIVTARAVYNSTTGVWCAPAWPYQCRPPDRVTLRYEAGRPLVNGKMEYRMQVLVARLAAAELVRPICACDAANRNLYEWQFDLARTTGANDESYGAISPDDLANPLGTRRGQVFAWKEIKQLMFIPGMVTI